MVRLQSHSVITLDQSYIDRNAVNEVKHSAQIAENRTQNLKPLVIWDFNEKRNEYFRELFQNVDTDNQETIVLLISEYNTKVKRLLVDIQAEYGFRLCCWDIEHNVLVVWADLLQVLVIRSSTPLAWVNQANMSANSNPNFNSYPHCSNSYLDRSSTPDRETWGEICRLEGVANQWNR